jgi:hypothetical protein
MYAVAGVAILVLVLILYGSYRGTQSDRGTETQGAGPAPPSTTDQANQKGPVVPPVGKEPVPPSSGRGSSSGGTTVPSGGASQLVLTFRDWEDPESQVGIQPGIYERPLMMKAALSGITGEYVNGILDGRFADGDFSKVTGQVTNTTNTGTTCASGKQTGSFIAALAVTAAAWRLVGCV